jgi:general secretion pathway protein L
MTVAADKEGKGWGWIGRAVPWWLGELAGLCDDAARRLGLAGRNAVTLEAGERYWLLRRGQRPLGQIDRDAPDDGKTGGETGAALARLALRGPIAIEIPQDRILTKRIALPAMAKRDLERILRFEIARHFPFPAERVYFRHRVIPRASAENGTIAVEIVAVAREVVDEILGALAAAGVRASSVGLAAGPGTPPLDLTIAGLARGERLTLIERVLLLSLAALAIAAAAAPVIDNRLRIAAAEQELAALQPQAQAALDRRDKQKSAAAALAGPLRLAAARPAVVAVLDALTRAVPDGSYLTALSLTGRELLVDGLSPSAAESALALERSHAFANIVFRAPITRDPESGLEHFALGAAVVEPKP